MQRLVEEFMKAMGQDVLKCPSIPLKGIQYLRMSLIDEEFAELDEAIEENDLVKIADALGDLLYVVYGTCAAYGIDIEPVFREIHRSNMTKVGGPVREDGKRLKPEGYTPPCIHPILEEQNERYKKGHSMPDVSGTRDSKTNVDPLAGRTVGA
jgi:predicted HAD superfamily Cof-like phosphohydrolase